MKETIEIGGKQYDVDSPSLTKDYFTKEFILIDGSVNIVSALTLSRTAGYEGSIESVNIHRDTFNARIAAGKVVTLVTRFGDVHMIQKVRSEGDGRIYPSNAPTVGRVYYDDYTNPRQNVKNKFRPFNNQVSVFKDIHNKLIPDQDRKKLIERNYNFGVDSPTYKISEGKNYTFGVELETSSGRLTVEDEVGLNLKCEFDGSLRETPDQRKEDVLGGEYITGVLKGDKGFYQLQRVCNTLSDRCTINGKCGVHVHIGNISFNKETIIYLYKLGELLQNEVYQMLPKSRRENAYCRKIKNITLDLAGLNSVSSSIGYDILVDEYYHQIFKEVSHGKEANRQHNKKSNHPMGSKCGYDKTTQRYCWLNFVTAMFNTKGNPEAITLEFRSHSATLNYTKIKNWVKICMAFVSFAENNKASIRRGYWLDSDKLEHNIDLSTIVRAAYPKSYKLLQRYIEDRKSKFAFDDGKIEELEYKTDKEGVKALTLKEDIQCAL